MQCRRLFSDFKPLAVLGMGGFTSTAPILAARLAGLPAFVHESNAIPGKANRLNSFLAGGLLVGLEDCARVMPETDCVFTGTPIRRALLSAPDQPEARKRFGLDGGLPTLLVMGGSQGAAGINRAMVDAAPLLKKDGLQVIHITGQSDEKMVRESYAKEGLRAWVGAFHHAMQDAYAAATLAIARSGAASLTELAHFELPSILIPFPFAAEDHQTFNALVFERAGAAKLVAEREVTPEKLVAEIRSMLLSGQRDGMIQGCRSVKIGDAAERVATVLEESAKGKGVFHE
jgi:UDP-N-acetylglucosamine--N-acetylmuramyl-(pentapeptide) pyrophosphoryl-undecaprenol N-acetylglucosamine transferase